MIWTWGTSLHTRQFLYVSLKQKSFLCSRWVPEGWELCPLMSTGHSTWNILYIFCCCCHIKWICLPNCYCCVILVSLLPPDKPHVSVNINSHANDGLQLFYCIKELKGKGFCVEVLHTSACETQKLQVIKLSLQLTRYTVCLLWRISSFSLAQPSIQQCCNTLTLTKPNYILTIVYLP